MKKRISIVSLKICKEKTIMYEPRNIHKAQDCYKLIYSLLGDCAKDNLIVISLNPRNEPTSIEVCSVGTSDMALVQPREVFKSALLSNATRIIIAHNHPSGSVEPSDNDKKVTDLLNMAAQILNIPLLDHIIVGDDTYFSFAENDLI